MAAFTFLLDPRVWAAIAVAVVLASAGAYMKGRGDGRELEAAAWLEKENKELVAANAEIQRLNDDARAAEEAHEATITAIGAEYASERESLEARRRSDVAAAHSGALKLRIPGACPARPGAGGPSEAGKAAGGRDDATEAELPGAVAADLLELANDADSVVRQLTSCQAVVQSFFPTTKGEP